MFPVSLISYPKNLRYNGNINNAKIYGDTSRRLDEVPSRRSWTAVTCEAYGDSQGGLD